MGFRFDICGGAKLSSSVCLHSFEQENFWKVAVIADSLFLFLVQRIRKLQTKGRMEKRNHSEEIINDIFKCTANVSFSSRFPLFFTITSIVEMLFRFFSVSFFLLPFQGRESHKFILKRYHLRMIEETAVAAKILTIDSFWWGGGRFRSIHNVFFYDKQTLRGLITIGFENHKFQAHGNVFWCLFPLFLHPPSRPPSPAECGHNTECADSDCSRFLPLSFYQNNWFLFAVFNLHSIHGNLCAHVTDVYLYMYILV